MIGIRETFLSLPWYVELIIAMIALFWMAQDITKQGMGVKYRWGFTILAVVAYFFAGVIGVAIVIAIYFVWSRAIYS
ncbi:MAG: hypothetical protein V5A88_06100 [Candidatus Thermoplasmatota archaeon]